MDKITDRLLLIPVRHEVLLVLGLFHKEGPSLAKTGVFLLTRDFLSRQSEVRIEGEKKCVNPSE